MHYFPQLPNGAAVQYPFVKRQAVRTALGVHLDGTNSKLPDAAGSTVRWNLTFRGLSDEERNAIESFFETMEGRLGEFTFLDPTANLLCWSEDLSSSAWVKGPALVSSGGVHDPAGGNRATRIRNNGAAMQTIEQTIPAACWFHYCFSFYARSDQPASLTLLRSTSTRQDSRRVTVGPDWKRLLHTGRSDGADERIRFGIGLDAGTTIDVYGMQAEAQPAPSPYRETTSRSGIYQRARFDNDLLSVTADGPGAHSCQVQIVAPLTE
jgi:hypothetical protein